MLDRGEVLQETHGDDVNPGAAEVVAGVGPQGRFNRGDGVEAVGTGADGAGVEGRIEETGPVEPLEEVLGEDADGGEAREEGGAGCGQTEDDGAQVRSADLNAGPGLAEARVALEVGGEDVTDGEGDIEGAHGSAVVPAKLGMEAEGVRAAVLADLREGARSGRRRPSSPARKSPAKTKRERSWSTGFSAANRGLMRCQAPTTPST